MEGLEAEAETGLRERPVAREETEAMQWLWVQDRVARGKRDTRGPTWYDLQVLMASRGLPALPDAPARVRSLRPAELEVLAVPEGRRLRAELGALEEWGGREAWAREEMAELEAKAVTAALVQVRAEAVVRRERRALAKADWVVRAGRVDRDSEAEEAEWVAAVE